MGFITQRSEVRILSPLPKNYKGLAKAADPFFAFWGDFSNGFPDRLVACPVAQHDAVELIEDLGIDVDKLVVEALQQINGVRVVFLSMPLA